MAKLKGKDESDKIEFSWGVKRGRGGANKEAQFYESFTYDGVEYFLYDSVYLFKDGEEKPYIGKIIKIWEQSNSNKAKTKTKTKKVKILWFFYPWEISNYISNENVLENEIFLATGDGKGLANVNPLDAIAGKCQVVCVSKDERNRQPSIEEIKMAHYVFYRTFDVQTHAISNKLCDKIATIEVNFLLNKSYFKSSDLPMVDGENVAVARDAIGSALVKDNEVGKSLLEPCHPVECDGATGPENTGSLVGMERKLIAEDLGGENEIVVYEGSVGSIQVKDDKASKRKGVATGPDSIVPVALPDAELALASSKEIKLSSADSKHEKGVVLLSDNRVTKKSKPCDSVHLFEQNAMNGLKPVDFGENCLEDSVSPASGVGNKQSKLVNDNHKADAVANVMSDDKQSKKRKIGDAALVSDKGETSTPKRATVMSNTASKSVGSVTKFNGISDGLSNKPKSDGLAGEKSIDKPCEVSVKKSEDKKGSAGGSIAAITPTQPANGLAESRKIVGTSNGLSKKLNSNIEDKSNDRSIMVESKSNGKNIKVEHKSNDKNIKVEHQSNDKMRNALVKEEPKDAEHGARGHVIEVTQRPHDRSKWFTASPWEDRMKDARDQRRLVLLQNLDPTYASSEVENIVWHAFKESCTAKVLQRTETSSQHSGQALIILKTQQAADKVVMMLEKKCLMLPNGRPIIGSREIVRPPGKSSPFPGHLVIDKLRHQLQRESREAVSTSHSSQPNTVEYEMALEWRLLQERSELWWRLMHKKQGEEIKKLKASLKSKKNQNELVVR